MLLSFFDQRFTQIQNFLQNVFKIWLLRFKIQLYRRPICSFFSHVRITFETRYSIVKCWVCLIFFLGTVLPSICWVFDNLLETIRRPSYFVKRLVTLDWCFRFIVLFDHKSWVWNPDPEHPSLIFVLCSILLHRAYYVCTTRLSNRRLTCCRSPVVH